MDSRITVNWWAIVLRGVIAILFGLVALFLTRSTLAAIVILFAAFLVVTGIFALVAGALAGSWLFAIEGVAGILIGALAFVYPKVTVLALALLIASWAILTGILEVWGAVVLRRVIANEWLLAVSGVLSILFGILVAIFPGAGLTAIVWVVGIYAILWGVLLLVLGFRLRNVRGRVVVST